MMYVLTEAEYRDLKAKQQQHELGLSTKKLQELCTSIADAMPVKWGWGEPDPKPWGCMLTAKKEGDEWYCDQCPVQSICPATQHFSK